MNEVNFVEQDAYYDDSIYNMLSQFNEEASNLYLSLNYLLKEKPICYPRLVAHCIREIISLLTRSINRTPDWRIGLKNAARVLDKKNEVLKGNYQDTLEYILSEADTQPQRIELLKEAILKLDNFITEDAAYKLANGLKNLKVHKFSHTQLEDDQKKEFDDTINSFNTILKIVVNSFIENRELIIKYVSEANEYHTEVCKILPCLKTKSLEYEFYNSIIEKNVEWFDILKQNNVFDYHSFLVKASQEGMTEDTPWEPFFYLKSVFALIPNKVSKVFQNIVAEDINYNPHGVSWKISQIIKLISENINQISSEDIISILSPLTNLKPENHSFYYIGDFLTICEKLIELKKEKFVKTLLEAILHIEVEKLTDKKSGYNHYKLTSWQDYYFLLENIEQQGFFAKYPVLSLNVFTSILTNIYQQFPDFDDVDDYGTSYLLNEDRTLQSLDCILVTTILKFAEKIEGQDLDNFYKELIPFANKGSKTIQNILFYYARVHEDKSVSYKFLLDYADNTKYPTFGSSDYALLVNSVFDKLKEAEKNAILNQREHWYFEYISVHKSLSEIDKERVIKRYFIIFQGMLTPEFEEKYGKVISGIDKKEYVTLNENLHLRSWRGDQSAISEEELSSKSFSDIVLFMKEFHEDERKPWDNKKSIQGTAEEIGKYLNKNKTWLNEIDLLEDDGINVKYHINLIINLKFTKDDNLDKYYIQKFLDYAYWLSEKENEDGFYSANQWMSNRIQEIIQNYDLSDKNFETIFNLSSNNVNKQDEKSQNLSLDADYYTASINSLIGENTTTLIRLGLKLSQLNKVNLAEQVANKLIDLINSKNLLVLAAVGRFYPWMELIFKNRMNELQAILFDQENIQGFKSWFGAYLLNSVYLNVFEVIKAEYQYAITVFSGEKRSIYQRRLADHFGVLFYAQEFTLEDDLGGALLEDINITKQAFFHIASSISRDEKVDLDRVSKCIDDLIAYTNKHNKWDDFAPIFDGIHFFIRVKNFNTVADWWFKRAIEILEHIYVKFSIFADDYDVIVNYIHDFDSLNNVLDFLSLFLINDKFHSQYYPKSSDCPYCYQEIYFNKIFDKILASSPNKDQKDKFDNIINALCNYGFYQSVKEYCEQ